MGWDRLQSPVVIHCARRRDGRGDRGPEILSVVSRIQCLSALCLFTLLQPLLQLGNVNTLLLKQ